ncbi:GNAT family N-acetyltransferase [Streptomyces nigrescens]|uniref:GNAT family N-acetyltransferase n=1 Tax=Streptomyces nigrescens TaxID=1920 RepID=A0ABY7IYB4_STRNI|nr:GNAT family N-acetyltransferase [Streptomyces nigrescens]WAU03989.1 GNAT family N-acetyltransferase [Streptomyces nigrescens]
MLLLVEADRIAGQPRATPEMLAEALAGRSPVDSGWWGELDAPRTDVAVDSAGNLVGVISYATRPSDAAGMVLWLHAQENIDVVAAMIRHVLDTLGPRTVYAFEMASALTLGMEGLPVGHRPVTARVLVEAGFTGRDLWRYMRASTPLTELPRAGNYTVSPCDEPLGKRLEVRDGEELVAEAIIGRPQAGIGVLWWITVAPAARRRGLGLAVLGSSADLLTGLGAEQVILYVDDDAPPGDPDRDRTAANRMYDQAGFVQVDRLHSYSRPA